MDRRLVAILSADVVGYSRLMAEDEDATVRTLAAYRDEIGLLVKQHRGRVVDSPGDNLLAEFPTATDAVVCAIEIQRVVSARNASLPADRKMEFRIGVHLGEIAFEADRAHGGGVNVAARLQALAEPGGICVSGAVHEQVGKKLAVSYRDLGPKSLKNIPEPVRAYQVRSDAPAGVAEVGRRGRRWGIAVAATVIAAGAVLATWSLLTPVDERIPSPGPIRSLAVLPLENLSGDPGQEYFADGMTEELIGALAKLGELRVISRTSVMQYKRERKPLREIARELDVDGIIEGTVTRAGDRVRITVQLIDARSDHHLWSERYDRGLRDVLTLQSEIARAVAEQIRLELAPEQRAALTPSRSVDPHAYDAYLRGLEARGAGVGSAQWAPGAIAAFERAVELDPGFAEGWGALAGARAWLGWSFARQNRVEFPKAREAAERALALDDRIGAAHAALGSVLLGYEWEFEAASRAYERALEVAPSDPAALDFSILYLLMVKRTEEALTLMERLLRVAPFDRFYRGGRVRNFYYARQYERALEELERIRERDPDYVDIETPLVYTALGRREEAHRAQLETYEQCGPPCAPAREALERGWRTGGWNASRRNVVELLAKLDGFSPFAVAGLYAQIEDTDAAFAWLARGYRERDPLMANLNVHPIFDPIRSDPRFQDLLRRIGFPEREP